MFQNGMIMGHYRILYRYVYIYKYIYMYINTCTGLWVVWVIVTMFRDRIITGNTLTCLLTNLYVIMSSQPTPKTNVRPSGIRAKQGVMNHHFYFIRRY